jgi:hypothetical protein
MIKNKAKKNTEKKSTKKSARKKLKKGTNPAEVRKYVSRIVESEAAEMTRAVVGEAKKGQLGPVKFLFEMANIFPAQTDPEHATEEEDSLAKILLSRMEAPAKPEEDDDDNDEPAGTEAEGKGPESLPAAVNVAETEKKEIVTPFVGVATVVT